MHCRKTIKHKSCSFVKIVFTTIISNHACVLITHFVTAKYKRHQSEMKLFSCKSWMMRSNSTVEILCYSTVFSQDLFSWDLLITKSRISPALFVIQCLHHDLHSQSGFLCNSAQVFAGKRTYACTHWCIQRPVQMTTYKCKQTVIHLHISRCTASAAILIAGIFIYRF